ncbi:MAG: hypothetical protein KKA84_04045 [Bacteroidetes bacterium]|nr:hypothetical protein [Bacteroidota bacterium]
MKRFISFILLATLLISCDTTTGFEEEPTTISKANESLFTISERARYMEDAYTLALRDMRANDPEYLEKTEIDESLVNNYYNALLHLASDEGIKNDASCNFLTFHCADIANRAIEISADSSVTWFKQIYLNIQSEEAQELNRILSEYQLEHYYFRDVEHIYHWAVKSKGVYNLDAVAHKINDIEGLSADAWLTSSKWHGLNAESKEGLIQFTRWDGVGDCLSGCPQHAWHFSVHFDGSVDFIGEEGSPIE